jgi:hypothetical protein
MTTATGEDEYGRTRVVLRRWRTGIEQPEGEVIALFPDQDWGHGLVNSYETVGGHGPASWASVVSRTDLVRRGEDGADAMLAELRRIGYTNPCQRVRRPAR